MKIQQLTKTIFSRQTLKDFVVSFISSLGVFTLVLEITDILWPEIADIGYKGLFPLLLASFAVGVCISFPKLKITKYFSTPDTTVIIRVGDIFDDSANTVIGFNDVFDTEIGAVVSRKSLQGQFLEKIYNNDRVSLDHDLSNALIGVENIVDDTKQQGKNLRYPLGTVVTLDRNDRKFFCVAYSRMESNLTATSDINEIWNSLSRLWEEIRLKGECSKVLLPVIGTDLARVAGGSHAALIKLILVSFIINSRIKIITKELVLVIHEENLGKLNLKEIKSFLSDL